MLAAMLSCISSSAQTDTDEEQWIEATLRQLTLEEKVNLCHQQGKFSSAGVPRLGIPPLWLSDGPHGVRMEIAWDKWEWAGWTTDSCTVFPALTALTATWNPSLAYQYGKALGEEALYRNKNIMLGPGVNIHRTPLNGRNFEYMGEDPYLTASLCVPYIQGVQDNHVASCIKHFALNNQETNRWTIDTYCSDRALHEIYLPAFKAAVEAGVWSVMGSYNKIRGTHACHNALTLKQILKGDWKFDGVVVSDWDGTHDTYEAAVNGLDLEMGTDSQNAGVKNMTPSDCFLGNRYLSMIQEGKVAESTLDDKVRRLLRLMRRTSMYRQKGLGSMTSAEHYATAEAIGNEAIVLLKNDKNILPIPADGKKNILVVGDNAIRRLHEGGQSSELKAKDMISPLEGMRQCFGNRITYTQGYTAGESVYGRAKGMTPEQADSLRRKAVEMARNADYVVLFGGLNKNDHQDCENSDRETYPLPFQQDELIDAILSVNKNLIVVLLSGTAAQLPWNDRVPAVVHGWYLGTMGGKSLANVLGGDINPSGKLPFTIGKELTDYGAHSFDKECYPGENGKVVYKEDILVGYRWFDTKHITPLYPFGHGLSYTTFKYDTPMVSDTSFSRGEGIAVSLSITNTGKRAGMETVQMYISDEECSVPRPAKELKGFQKVRLEPGESTTVSFMITEELLQFYSPEQGGWTAEPGRFKVMIGSSSADIRQTVDITLR